MKRGELTLVNEIPRYRNYQYYYYYFDYYYYYGLPVAGLHALGKDISYRGRLILNASP